MRTLALSTAAPFSAGRYLPGWSSSESLPVATAYEASVAAKVLLIEPSSNKVCSVTGVRCSREAMP